MPLCADAHDLTPTVITLTGWGVHRGRYAIQEAELPDVIVATAIIVGLSDHGTDPPSPARPPSILLCNAVLAFSGVTTWWTGVDMFTALLLEVAAEIDTNPTSFYRGGAVGPLGDPSPDPRYRLALRARHVSPPHIF